MSITCPTCAAPAGTSCDGRGGHHFARVMRAEAVEQGNTGTDDT